MRDERYEHCRAELY